VVRLAGVVCVGLAGCGFGADAPGAGVADGSPGVEVADAAIDGEVPVDALVDAAPCPASYDANGHRGLVATGTWLAAEAACEADAPGRAHLVVLDDDAERAAVATLIQALPGDAWVGIVRYPGDPWEWRYVTGGPATYAPFEGAEPNNMSGNQFVTVIRRSSGFLYDYGVDQAGVYAVCECDGRPPVDADYTP
jgi:hypothetical protein